MLIFDWQIYPKFNYLSVSLHSGLVSKLIGSSVNWFIGMDEPNNEYTN